MFVPDGGVVGVAVGGVVGVFVGVDRGVVRGVDVGVDVDVAVAVGTALAVGVAVAVPQAPRSVQSAGVLAGSQPICEVWACRHRNRRLFWVTWVPTEKKVLGVHAGT